MIVLIDNYDSFTYNLYQYLMELTEVKIYRNDEISIEDLMLIKPNAIVISPGPGIPSEAGITEDIIKAFKGVCPILGICLGHQGIGEAFGGKVVRCKEIMHGKKSIIDLKESKIFQGLEREIEVMRYHSLVVERQTLPKELDIIAETKDGIIMAIEYKKYSIFGIQFHPESIFTEAGKSILKNFVGGISYVN